MVVGEECVSECGVVVAAFRNPPLMNRLSGTSEGKSMAELVLDHELELLCRLKSSDCDQWYILI